MATKDLHQIAEDSARGGIFLVLGATLTIIGYAVAAIIVARLLGPEIYGLYTISLTLSQMLFLFADLGINQGLIRFSASYLEQKKKEKIKTLVKHGIILKIIFALILFLINFVFAEVFATNILHRPELTVHVRLASFAILFQVIYQTSNSIFIGIGKTEYGTISSGIQSASRAIISVALVIAGFSIAGAVLGYVAGFAVGALITTGILLRFFNNFPKDEKHVNFSGNMELLIKYGIPIYFSTILIGLIDPYQSIILALFSTNFEIGNFKASYNFVSLIAMVTLQITNALLPAFSRISTKKNTDPNRFFKFANKYTTILVVPITIAFIAFSQEIIKIMYGTIYDEAAFFLSLNCSLYLLVGLGYLTLTSLFNGLGKTKYTFNTSLLTFVIALVLSPILITYYKVPGLISALLIAYLIGTVYAHLVARRTFQIKPATKSLIIIYVICMLSTLPSLLIKYLNLQTSTVIILSLELILYFAAYSTLLPMSQILTYFELDKAYNIINKIKLVGRIAKPFFQYQKFIMRKSSKNTQKKYT